jgi:uncharacterized protein (DUF1810 family)
MSDQLERFMTEQDAPETGIESALDELRAGRKRSHWIWYVFPQLSGLGSSSMAQRFGLDGVEEAEAYLANEVLRRRLLEAATIVARQLRAGVPIERLMGASIDVLKLVSSMTLFGALASGRDGARTTPGSAGLADAAREILRSAAQAGYPACRYTREALTAAGYGVDG